MRTVPEADKSQVAGKQFTWSGQVRSERIDFMKDELMPVSCNCSNCGITPIRTGKKGTRAK